MGPRGEEATRRYVRLLVHDHPLRGEDYIRSLLERGMSADQVRSDVLVPARRRLLKMRTAHQLNAADTAMALTMIREAIEKLSNRDVLALGRAALRSPSVPYLADGQGITPSVAALHAHDGSLGT